MDKRLIFELGSYLNDWIGPYNTCNDELTLTARWLDENGYDVDEVLKTLQEKGISCDCQVVVNLYIPMLFGMVKPNRADAASSAA